MYTLGLAETLCNNSQFLLHVVAGCAKSLDRYAWRHDSVPNYMATSLNDLLINYMQRSQISAHQALSQGKKCGPTFLSSWTGRKCS